MGGRSGESCATRRNVWGGNTELSSPASAAAAASSGGVPASTVAPSALAPSTLAPSALGPSTLASSRGFFVPAPLLPPQAGTRAMPPKSHGAAAARTRRSCARTGLIGFGGTQRALAARSRSRRWGSRQTRQKLG